MVLKPPTYIKQHSQLVLYAIITKTPLDLIARQCRRRDNGELVFSGHKDEKLYAQQEMSNLRKGLSVCRKGGNCRSFRWLPEGYNPEDFVHPNDLIGPLTGDQYLSQFPDSIEPECIKMTKSHSNKTKGKTAAKKGVAVHDDSSHSTASSGNILRGRDPNKPITKYGRAVDAIVQLQGNDISGWPTYCVSIYSQQDMATKNKTHSVDTHITIVPLMSPYGALDAAFDDKACMSSDGRGFFVRVPGCSQAVGKMLRHVVPARINHAYQKKNARWDDNLGESGDYIPFKHDEICQSTSVRIMSRGTDFVTYYVEFPDGLQCKTGEFKSEKMNGTELNALLTKYNQVVNLEYDGETWEFDHNQFALVFVHEVDGTEEPLIDEESEEEEAFDMSGIWEAAEEAEKSGGSKFKGKFAFYCIIPHLLLTHIIRLNSILLIQGMFARRKQQQATQKHQVVLVLGLPRNQLARPTASPPRRTRAQFVPPRAQQSVPPRAQQSVPPRALIAKAIMLNEMRMKPARLLVPMNVRGNLVRMVSRLF